jgi:type II secretory pathway component GspD/PulD (secretin)
MKIGLHRLSTAALVVACGVAAAQQEMEIIPLRAQTVDRVLPVLLPLLEPGGTLTGMNDQLFLRASPANRADIKRALAAIDVPARRLVIHVATTREALEAGRGAAVAGQVVIGEEKTQARISATARDSQAASSQRAGQMVRTTEGSPAFIQAGRSLPLPMRQAGVGPGGAIVTEGVVYRDVGSGFYATPRVSGDRVTLEISQQAEGVSLRGYGAIDSQRLATTVSGRLGEWMEIGGVSREASGGGRAIGLVGIGGGVSSASESGAIWLKVEEVR